jgi:hypothetical protein
MAKSVTNKYNYDKANIPASIDEALVDEFCSLIAGIVRRINKEQSSGNKNKSELEKEKKQ